MSHVTSDPCAQLRVASVSSSIRLDQSCSMYRGKTLGQTLQLRHVVEDADIVTQACSETKFD